MGIGIKKKRRIFGVLLFVFVLNFVFAASILDELHLNIQTTDTSDNVITGTFDFDFNISTTSDCNNVIYSDSASLTTDSRGIISYYLSSASMNYDNQYYLCYYRDGTLIDSSKIARSPYAFRAKYVNTSGIQVDSNLDLSGFNLTSDYVFGDGSGLTNLNVSSIDLSDYVPYTGANQNLVLGDNNFSVGGTDLFVNADTGFVGVGTSTQPDVKTFFSVYQAASNANIRVETDSSGAYASIQMLSGARHWELGTQETYQNGNLIIRPSASGNSEMFNFVSSGRFGIGTSTPQNKLNVIGDINATGYIYGDGSQLTNLNVSNIDLSDYVPYTGADKNVDLGNNNFSVGGTDLFVDSVSGNVGIGTTTLTSALNIAGTINMRTADNSENRGRWDPGATGTVDGTITLSDKNAATSILLNSGNGAISYLRQGKLGIGTATPQNTLNVVGDINATGYIYGDGSQLTNLNLSGVNGSTQWKDSGSDIYYDDGNVGIGTTSPQSKLNINGTYDLAGGLTFGDGDTGIYETVDDWLTFKIGGQYKAAFFNNYFEGSGSDYFAINMGIASATNPIFTFRQDYNTGIGHAGADQLSLIAGGVEGIRVQTTGAVVNGNLNVTQNLSVGVADVYIDGEGDMVFKL